MSLKNSFYKNYRGLIATFKDITDKSHCCDIPKKFKTLDKKTLFLHHGIGVIIGDGTTLGNNCIIHPNVIIGSKNEICPIIGNGVVIYGNSTIFGNITIGNNVVIGAGSVVLESIPSD